MAFDQATRNRLARFVGDGRSLLTEEFTRQLQHEYGIDPTSGEVANLDRLSHLDDTRRETAIILRDTLTHYMAGQAKQTVKIRQDMIDRIIREQAFTVLNRLCALRMMEARGLLLESVVKGYQSRGFQLYNRLAGSALGETGDTYRSYLSSLFDEFAVDLPVLFDRFSPQGRLFPRPTTLLQLLDEINHPDIDPLWAEDETIGWIYQYFNSVEERRQMRAASQAPRNSRELAVRNQFFTPRYVVEFLTDNTLGRIWYEMTQGETALAESCRYLVRRPHEIFLAKGEAAPEQPENEADLSQEELLQQPVYILYRPLKDPRDIKMLDPACGSMHFGLYAFDLYEQIYAEAWHLETSRGAHAFTRPEEFDALHKTYADETAFRRDVPRLIIEHNIHGIDIDPRAVQIAGLSLWLRAQKSWQAQGVKPQDRPIVTRSNVVTAEPMPGDTELLDEFIEQYLSDTAENRLLGQLVKRVFEAMKLAGEAGSLLKIEQEIDADITEAKEKWYAKPQPQQAGLFEEASLQSDREASKLDVSEITDEAFWDQVEERIYEALRLYAEQAENGDGFRRRLFAGDTARGFAFIDHCRQQYDVILMNPPFGESAKASKNYINNHYKNSSGDIFQAFVERGIQSLHSSGREGVISARTGFFLGNSKSWRENVIFTRRLVCFADLGLGVLDDALVEVAAYVTENTNPSGNFILTNRQLDNREKGERLQTSTEATQLGDTNGFNLFDQALLNHIPDYTFAYWAPSTLLRRYSNMELFGSSIAKVRQGVATADDFRFARLGWEVRNNSIGKDARWQRFSKGGEYSPPYDDIHLLVDWGAHGKQLKAFPNCFIRNENFYFKSGATYTVRTASAFTGKILPEDCIFSHNAQSWFPDSKIETLISIGYLSSRVAQTYLELAVGSGDIATSGSAARRYTTAVVESVPTGVIKQIDNSDNLRSIRELFAFRVTEFASDETSCHFSFFHVTQQAENLLHALNTYNHEWLQFAVHALAESAQLDRNVCKAFELTDAEQEFVNQEVGLHPTSYSGKADTQEVLQLLQLSESELISQAIDKYGSKRWFTKKSYFVDRKLEIICHYLEIAPKTLQSLIEGQYLTFGQVDYAKSVLSESLGCVFGRWDIRLALEVKPQKITIEDEFAPLPLCPPAMLVNSEGQPATALDVPADYPLRISWHGILTNTQGHFEDIEARIHEALHLIWKELADDIEQESCEILGISSLREYFNNPNGFFDDHLKRYSKSRRAAPIYWPLTTSFGTYTLWLYYHRLDDQTLYTCINDFVDPKLQDVTRQVQALRQRINRSQAQEEDLTRLADLEAELKDFRTELLLIASFWRPNLNDGVQITAAPLWRLFQHRQWQNKLKDIWEKLEAGEYDWAHLAMSIWPERVVPKCVSNRSLSIAHDLENLFWVEDDGNWRLLQAPDQEIAEQKKRRQIPTHDRLRQHLEALAAGSGRGIPAYQVWQHLSEGNWDDTAVALALWPERVGEKCWDNPLMAAHMGLKSPPKRTKANRNRFLKRILEESTPELAQAVAAAFQDEEAAFDVVWQAMVKGDEDEQSLALALWPARVIDKCAANVEIAIQHDLHRYFWYQSSDSIWRRRKPQSLEIKDEITRRQAQK